MKSPMRALCLQNIDRYQAKGQMFQHLGLQAVQFDRVEQAGKCANFGAIFRAACDCRRRRLAQLGVAGVAKTPRCKEMRRFVQHMGLVGVRQSATAVIAPCMRCSSR